jgi:transposase
MTKDKSHRELFISKVLDEGLTVEEAAFHCSISARTGSRWLRQLLRTGSFLPLRHRTSIPGKMPEEDQEALFTIIANNRTRHIEELTQLLLEETNHNHSERLVKQVMFRKNYVYKLANHLAPLERDPELRRYWIEQVLGGDAVFTSDQFLFVDESSKKLKDCRRPRVFAVCGDHVQIPVVHTRSGNAASIIASLSIEGVQSVTVVDVNEEGNIDGERFLDAFIDDILSICEPFPGKRSVIVMDNAQIHLKLLIDAECLQRNIIILYLPPYSFDFNPIELCFNAAKMKLQKDYGLGILPPNVRIGDLFRNCLLTCMTSEIACNMFVKCHVHVSDDERAWAAR